MTEIEKSSFEQIKEKYDMPFLEFGMNAIVNGNAVRIVGVSNDKLKGKLVNFKNEILFHPINNTAYYNERWEIIRDYRQNKE